MIKRLSAWILTTKAAAKYPKIAAWTAKNLGKLLIGLGAFVTIFICWVILSKIYGDTTTVTPSFRRMQPSPPAGGWFFWKFLAVLESVFALVAYIHNSQSKRMPLFFLAAAVGSCIVFLGKLDGIFSWATAGLPIISALSFIGYKEAPDKTRVKTFLGFTLGFTIIAWMYLFIQSMINPDLLFLGDRITDPTLQMIGLFSGILFAIAMLRDSFVFYTLSLVIFSSWLGQDVFNSIESRFPKQLNPNTYISQKTKSTWERFWDNVVLGGIDKLSSSPTPTPTPTPIPMPTPAPTPVLTPAPGPRVNQSATPQGVAQPITVQIKKDGATPYWKELPAGEYKIEPRRAQFVRDGEKYISDSNGLLSLNKKMLVNFYLPGAEIGIVTITPK